MIESLCLASAAAEPGGGNEGKYSNTAGDSAQNGRLELGICNVQIELAGLCL
jgi:hypothetical protein